MSIQLFRKIVTIIFISISYSNYSQSNQPVLIANNHQNFIVDLMNPDKSKSTKVQLKSNQTYDFKLRSSKNTNEGLILTGGINNEQRSTFSIKRINNTLEGRIIQYDLKKAYRLYSIDTGEVFMKEIDINTVVCTDFEKVNSDKKEESSKRNTASRAPLLLESLPGATGVIYIDFDGELVTDTSWVNSGTINAQSPNFSDAKITEIWKIMAEDFRPFKLNVTTRRDIFEAAPLNRRIMCIFTTTKDAAPKAGGVAYINSFSWNSFKEPCWVYNLNTRAAGETGSHEVGHALGLEHDGTPGEDNDYYSGHGQWSPIMGWSANKTLGHWSIGEYPNANNTQDDVAIISNTRNGVGYQEDDHGNTITDATTIKVSSSGVVNPDQNFGLITTREDKDVFSFVIETGNVTFSLKPDPDYPNLNIQARILNELGEEVAISDPQGLNASIDENLSEGTYFLEIDGVGEGNLITGYSDYSSLGNYFITGNYTPGDDKMPPLSDFEVTQNCFDVEFKNRSTNIVTSYLWDFGDGKTATQENPTHTYETNGTYTVSLITTNNSGNNKKEKVNFIKILTPSQPIANDQTACIGESVTITPTGNSNYKWYTTPTGGTSIASGETYQTPTLSKDNTYYIEGTLNGCTTNTRTAVKITVTENVQQPIVTNQSICNGQSTSLTIIGDNQYEWFKTPTGGTSIASGTTFTTPTLTQNTTYYIEGANENCKATVRSEIKVIVKETPQEPTLQINEDFSILSVTSEYDAYQWFHNETIIDNANQAEYSPEKIGEYYVEVFNESGCSVISNSFTMQEIVSSPPNNSDLHSYFPNPVKYDDYLYINGLTQEDHSINIVNLRGQIVIKSTPTIGQQKIDISILQKGLYIIVVNNEPLGKLIKE